MNAPSVVYMCWGAEGEAVYIGRTAHLAQRLRSHRERLWWSQVEYVTHSELMPFVDADATERAAIRSLSPWANVFHRAAPTIALRRRNARLDALKQHDLASTSA